MEVCKWPPGLEVIANQRLEALNSKVAVRNMVIILVGVSFGIWPNLAELLAEDSR